VKLRIISVSFKKKFMFADAESGREFQTLGPDNFTERLQQVVLKYDT